MKNKLITYFLPAAVINDGGLPSSHILFPSSSPLWAFGHLSVGCWVCPCCFPLSAYFHRVFVGLCWPLLAAVSLCGPALAFRVVGCCVSPCLFPLSAFVRWPGGGC